jgi:hypothetical protein
MHQYPDYDMPGVASGPGMMIRWQEGPVAEGVNGALPELPIRAVLEHMGELQDRVPCDENGRVIRLLHEVLWLLDARTRERHGRGVLGTEEK